MEIDALIKKHNFSVSDKPGFVAYDQMKMMGYLTEDDLRNYDRHVENMGKHIEEHDNEREAHLKAYYEMLKGLINRHSSWFEFEQLRWASDRRKVDREEQIQG